MELNTRMSGERPSFRPTVAEIDLDAIRANTAALGRAVHPAAVCAVVKANGYGHGAVGSARAALAGGASWLAVALVEEAIELREAGIDAPILLLSEFPIGAASALVQHRITATVYSFGRIDELDEAARSEGCVADVHVKVDTGMHRVGAQPDDVVALVDDLAARFHVRHTGTFTHFAVADDPSNDYTNDQIERFAAVLEQLREHGHDPGIVHAANSAGGIAHPKARFDLVRFGVSLYGNDPDLALRAEDFGIHLRPAMRLATEVSHVKTVRAGARVSYGLRYALAQESVVATIPIGYADGVPRRLSSVGGEALLHGRRVPMAGRVTMDQILLDCGPPDPERPIAVGDAVVLLGSDGDQSITPWEWAERLDTIAYEITCGISSRVPRRSLPLGGLDG